MSVYDPQFFRKYADLIEAAENTPEEELEEGWKQNLAAAALAAGIGLGGGGPAHAAPVQDQTPAIHQTVDKASSGAQMDLQVKDKVEWKKLYDRYLNDKVNWEGKNPGKSFDKTPAGRSYQRLLDPPKHI
jgi:hypothetical protein